MLCSGLSRAHKRGFRTSHPGDSYDHALPNCCRREVSHTACVLMRFCVVFINIPTLERLVYLFFGRYAAKQFGLCPASADDEALADMISACAHDYIGEGRARFHPGALHRIV